MIKKNKLRSHSHIWKIILAETMAYAHSLYNSDLKNQNKKRE